MAAPKKKVKVYRTTLKHGNTYQAGPYHFMLGRAVDILERDVAIAQHLAKHPSFTVVETYIEVATTPDVYVPTPIQPEDVAPDDQEGLTNEDVGEEDESNEVQGETAAAHPEIAQTPSTNRVAAPRRVPKNK